MVLPEIIKEKLKTLKNEVDKVEDFIDFKILALDCNMKINWGEM